MRWFKRWFSTKEGENTESPDCYMPRERFIYSFWDGEKQRKVDPLVYYKRMRRRWTDITIAWKVAGSISSKAVEGQEKLIDAIRDVFQVKNHESGGLSEIECVELIIHFVAYCDALQKKTPLFPMFSTTQWSPQKPSSEEEESPTPDSSDYGSTENEPIIGGLTPSVSELALPSETSSPEASFSSP